MGSLIGGVVGLAGYLGCYVLPAFMSGEGQQHPPKSARVGTGRARRGANGGLIVSNGCEDVAESARRAMFAPVPPRSPRHAPGCRGLGGVPPPAPSTGRPACPPSGDRSHEARVTPSLRRSRQAGPHDPPRRPPLQWRACVRA